MLGVGIFSNLEKKSTISDPLLAQDISSDIKIISDEEFTENARSQIEYLEDLRLSKLSVYNWRKKIGSGIAVVGVPICGWIDYLLLSVQSSGDDDAFGVTVALIAGIIWWVTQPKRQYVKAYKSEILPRIAKLLGNLDYSVNGKINMAKLKPSKILPSHNTYSSEDYFSGTYKGVGIEIAETELVSGSGKNRKTKFKGLFFLLNLNRKNFHGHTILLSNTTKVQEWFQEKKSGLKKANMVSPEFEKRYDCYTNDQVEARYLLDPVMIEKLQDLRLSYFTYSNGVHKQISAAFFGKTFLFIMLPSKHNHFEHANIHVSAMNVGVIKSMRRELQSVLSLIDYLEFVKEERT